MEERDGPGLHGESEPSWLALVHGLPSEAHLSMVSTSHAAGCVSTAGEAPAPESKEVSESPSHPGRQPNPGGGGGRVEVGVGVRIAVKAITLLSQELSLVVLAHN